MTMKFRFRNLVGFVFFLLFSWDAFSAEKEFYTVGVVPQFEARKLHSIWRPILNFLEQETGYKLKIRGSTSIPEFEKEFEQGKFDFVYMNPYHMVIANEKAGYIPLVRDHGRLLYGVLVVRKDSPFQSPKDLDGKKVAYPAPNALGASLQMRQELNDDFGVKTLPQYVTTHDSVYLNVLMGLTAAGGGVQKTLEQQKKQYQEALRTIHTTTKVYPHPFSALPSVPEEVRKAIQKAFLTMGETEKGRDLLSHVPIKKVGPAQLEDYLPLKKMRLERFHQRN